MTDWLGRALRVLLHLHDSPHRTALAFGIGLWIAFCPLLGLHTVMALAIAFAFHLNRVAILAGAYVNNPWTLAPLYLAGTAFGCVLLGVPLGDLGAIDWSSQQALREGLATLWWPYVVGNSVLGVVAGLIGYLILRTALERRSVLPAQAEPAGAPR